MYSTGETQKIRISCKSFDFDDCCTVWKPQNWENLNMTRNQLKNGF